MERRRNKTWLDRVISWFSYLLMLGKLSYKYQVLLKELIRERQERLVEELMRGNRYV